MQIDPDILIAYGGFAKKLEKGSIVFREGAQPYFYYQVLEGEIKMFSSNTEGKELVQGVFNTGDSFGEPPLLLNKLYPSTAQVCRNSLVIKISKENLFHIFNDYPDLLRSMLFTFAERIYHKATTVQILLSSSPEERIVAFLHKSRAGAAPTMPTLVPYTRQQIADFTGLRVETVIRTLKRMCEEGRLSIVDHKVYF